MKHEIVPLNFVVVGGQRCGTGWLAQCLREHPGVCMVKDESGYFTKNYNCGAKWWVDNYLLNGDTRKIVGEKCANYLTSKTAAERIASVSEDIKIIICVRNPIDRYRSARLMKNRIANGGVETEELDDEDFEKGLFGKYCELYVSLFNKENTLIVFYEDMVQKQEHALKAVFQFLGVDPQIKPKSTFRQTKPGAFENRFPLFGRITFILLHPRSPVNYLYSNLRRMLEKKSAYSEFDLELQHLYREDISRLEAIAGRSLASWKG